MTTKKELPSVPQEHLGDAEDMNSESGVQTEQPELNSETTPDEPTNDQHGEEHHEKIDFSEEEAALASDAPEFELGDEMLEHEDHQDNSFEHNFVGKNKEELIQLMGELLQSKPVQQLRREVEAIKIAFYKTQRNVIDQLKREYAEAGKAIEEFVAPVDDMEVKLKELFAEYRRKRDEFIHTLEHKKEDNLKIKAKIIEDLKELVTSNETINHTFNTFRDLQQRWKDTGPVPASNNKDLWDTYHHHVENFYNFIKINKELRDLDLKRNYEAKLQLCEDAEALMLDPSVVNAFHKLQKLHDQWREIGPVANEYKESLWERFRDASSRINKQHQDYFDSLKEEQRRNFELKTELCVKVEELSAEMLTSRKDWNKASDQLTGIQKIWKTIGFAPKKENTKIYERFRNSCDRFFEQKRIFYSQLKTEADLNHQLKLEICALAELLSNSEDWKKSTDELIALQKRWKDIGTVPRRYSDTIWKRFRAACDLFFERKSSHFSSVDSEHEQNLQSKIQLLEELEAFDTQNIKFDDIKAFQRRWSEIGFVPIKQKDAIQARYKKVVDKMFASLKEGAGVRQIERYRDKVSTMKVGSGDKQLRFERDRLYNKVKQLEADIALLENNIGFFSKSKNAEAMIRDVKDKIENAKIEMANTIEKINVIDGK